MQSLLPLLTIPGSPSGKHNDRKRNGGLHVLGYSASPFVDGFCCTSEQAYQQPTCNSFLKKYEYFKNLQYKKNSDCFEDSGIPATGLTLQHHCFLPTIPPVGDSWTRNYRRGLHNFFSTTLGLSLSIPQQCSKQP